MNSNANNEFLNRTAPEDHQLPGMETEYPMAQWCNGFDAAQPPLGNGGFELPAKHFQDLITGCPVLDIPHRRGTVKEPGYLLPVMHLAIIACHTAYFKENGDNMLWSATPKFDEGYKSRALYFCYAAEIEQAARLTPFILSLKSKVAQEFKALLKLFRSQILATADQFSGNRNPHYFFYVPVGSNGRVFYPDAPTPYTIAPPTAYWDTSITEVVNEAQINILRELAIPDYLYQHILSAGWDEAKTWRETMAAKGSNGNGDNNAPPSPNAQAQEPPQDPAPISPELDPISQDQAEYEQRESQFHGEHWQAPPPPSPPMSEAQAVASAQAGGPAMTNEEARKKFQDSIGQAIVNGHIDHITAAKLANDANQEGWLGALAILENAMAA